MRCRLGGEDRGKDRENTSTDNRKIKSDMCGFGTRQGMMKRKPVSQAIFGDSRTDHDLQPCFGLQEEPCRVAIKNILSRTARGNVLSANSRSEKISDKEKKKKKRENTEREKEPFPRNNPCPKEPPPLLSGD